MKIAQGRQSYFPLGVEIKGIAWAFNWLKCLSGILHLKPPAGCQISTLIFGFFGGKPYIYPMTKCQRTEKFFPTRNLDQRYCTDIQLT